MVSLWAWPAQLAIKCRNSLSDRNRAREVRCPETELGTVAGGDWKSPSGRTREERPSLCVDGVAVKCHRSLWTEPEDRAWRRSRETTDKEGSCLKDGHALLREASIGVLEAETVPLKNHPKESQGHLLSLRVGATLTGHTVCGATLGAPLSGRPLALSWSAVSSRLCVQRGGGAGVWFASRVPASCGGPRGGQAGVTRAGCPMRSAHRGATRPPVCIVAVVRALSIFSFPKFLAIF